MEIDTPIGSGTLTDFGVGCLLGTAFCVAVFFFARWTRREGERLATDENRSNFARYYAEAAADRSRFAVLGAVIFGLIGLVAGVVLILVDAFR